MFIALLLIPVVKLFCCRNNGEHTQISPHVNLRKDIL